MSHPNDTALDADPPVNSSAAGTAPADHTTTAQRLLDRVLGMLLKPRET